jgi:MFS transporter, DHA1 family, inner membrane transport protein
VLASSFNIAAFNLGNAIGAWLGGAVISHGPGLGAVTWAAALVTVLGFAVALWSVRSSSRPVRSATVAACTDSSL